MKSNPLKNSSAFTLLETVIAIGVLAVLLSGFLVVFAPAAAGIRQSINSQQADRLASALEEEMATLRQGQLPGPTSFDKSFDWILKSDKPANAILVYQYRGDAKGALRNDGTRAPVGDITGKAPGTDFVVVPMARRRGDVNLTEDLKALEGAVYLVKPRQLIFGKNGMALGNAGEIKNPKPESVPPAQGPFTSATAYPEATLAFAAEFHQLPSTDSAYLASGSFSTKLKNAKNPVFIRNLAVRR